jgi:dTDP-4-amino-4,6-dideoxygalactose transaminase
VTDDAARQELLDAVDTVLRHGRIVLGPEVEEFEQRVAALCGRRFGVGVNSGTDALFLGLKALKLGPGDEVIVPALSWVATANAVAMTGAEPVFADIGDDLNIDPASVERLITARTRAILPVHFTGRICDMTALEKIAGDRGIPIVEDAAQAFGARRGDRPAGSFGVMTCFSMNPMKVLNACGEAGIVLTDDEAVWQRLISLRYNGTVNREQCIEVSINGRLDTIQAAMLLRRLRRLPEVIARRREIASWYCTLLDGVVDTPAEKPEELSVYYTFTIQADRRDDLRQFLERRGIETKIQHPILMPDQPVYVGRRGDYPNARRLVSRILCLPAHEKLVRDDVEYVARAVKEFYSSHPAGH